MARAIAGWAVLVIVGVLASSQLMAWVKKST
jgi:hypothetical protein